MEIDLNNLLQKGVGLAGGECSIVPSTVACSVCIHTPSRQPSKKSFDSAFQSLTDQMHTRSMTTIIPSHSHTHCNHNHYYISGSSGIPLTCPHTYPWELAREYVVDANGWNHHSQWTHVHLACQWLKCTVKVSFFWGCRDSVVDTLHATALGVVPQRPWV